MEKFNLTSEEVDRELIIDNSSIEALVENLKSHPRKEAKYQRFSSQANKEVSRLTLALEILTAEIVEEEIKKYNSSSASLRQELRKSVVKDPRYQELRLKLIDAQETADLLNGLVSAWVSRGYRLLEITKLADRLMGDSLRVYNTDPMKLSDEAATLLLQK